MKEQTRCNCRDFADGTDLDFDELMDGYDKDPRIDAFEVDADFQHADGAGSTAADLASGILQIIHKGARNRSIGRAFDQASEEETVDLGRGIADSSRAPRCEHAMRRWARRSSCRRGG